MSGKAGSTRIWGFFLPFGKSPLLEYRVLLQATQTHLINSSCFKKWKKEQKETIRSELLTQSSLRLCPGKWEVFPTSVFGGAHELAASMLGKMWVA